MKIALIGDYNAEVPAHQAIPLAISLTNHPSVTYQWVHSTTIGTYDLSAFSAFWCVPASPYASMENVLQVIQYARTHNIPFLGTCGGYQHAALEYARNALGFTGADNAEVVPDTEMPLISGLSCKLYDVKNTIKLTAGSFIQSIYGVDQISEEYFCGYGVNTKYLSIFNDSDLSFSGFDEGGDPRALEIKGYRFFVGTAFQPERSAFTKGGSVGQAHPLIKAFVDSVSATAQ